MVTVVTNRKHEIGQLKVSVGGRHVSVQTTRMGDGLVLVSLVTFAAAQLHELLKS